MQNNFEELWCLMDWAVPGCLGKKSYFMDHFAKAMQIGQKIDSDNAQHQQVGLKYAAGFSFCLAVVNIELKPIFQFSGQSEETHQQCDALQTVFWICPFGSLQSSCRHN